MLDRFARPLRNLRLSVTDRCNLRCAYCMPEEDYVWLPKRDVLSYEELGRLLGAFRELGTRKVRLTGGEPLLRRDLPTLVGEIAQHGFDDVALTTNATRLRRSARELKAAGLARLTVSLDTLRADRFRRLTRRDELDVTLDGIDAGLEAGLPTKLNVVLMRHVNLDELEDLLVFGRERGIEVRFIEYMDVGGATRWNAREVVPLTEILERVAERFGTPAPLVPADDLERSAPATRFQLQDGTVFGVVASTTKPFCGACDRARLTADGLFYTCLYAPDGLDLRTPLRAGATCSELVEIVRQRWSRRDDRGAEERLAATGREALVDRGTLAHDPHLEMHTRGG